MSIEDLIGAAAERDGPASDAVSGTVGSMTLSLDNGQRTPAARAPSVASSRRRQRRTVNLVTATTLGRPKENGIGGGTVSQRQASDRKTATPIVRRWPSSRSRGCVLRARVPGSMIPSCLAHEHWRRS